jgi:hypothetical protein
MRFVSPDAECSITIFRIMEKHAKSDRLKVGSNNGTVHEHEPDRMRDDKGRLLLISGPKE